MCPNYDPSPDTRYQPKTDEPLDHVLSIRVSKSLHGRAKQVTHDWLREVIQQALDREGVKEVNRES